MKFADRTLGSIIALTFWKAMGGLVSVGIVITMASAFGAGSATDAFLFARKIISNVANLVERSAHYVFVPGYVAAARHSGRAALGLNSRRVQRTALAVSVVVCSALLVFARPLVTVMAPGFGAETLEAAVLYFRIILVSLPLTIAASIAGAALNSVRHYAVPTIAGLLPRIFMLVVLSTPLVIFGLTLVSVALVIGTFLMALLFALATRYTLRDSDEREEVPPLGEAPQSNAMQVARMRIGAMIVGQVHVLAAAAIDMAFASMTGVGGVAILEYGQRLVNMAPGMVASSISVVYYTELASALATNDRLKFRQFMADAMRRSFLMIAPMAAVIFALREPIVFTLLGHGAFSAEAAAATSQVVGILAPLLLISSLIGTLFSTLMVDDEIAMTTVATVSSVLALAARVAVDWFAIDRLGLLAVPLGMLAGLFTLFAVMFAMMRRHYGPMLGEHGTSQLLRLLVAAASAMLVMILLSDALLATHASQIEDIIMIGMVAALGVAVYVVIGWLLGIPEIRSAISGTGRMIGQLKRS